MPRTPGLPVAAATALLLPALLVLGACAAEPTAGPTSTSPRPSVTASATPSASAPASPSMSPSASPMAGDDIALPTACEQIYSSAMLVSLQAANPPLNDPGVTMHSTQNAQLLEVLSSGIPTLRCSWGQPSEYGLATNVSIVTAEQSAAVQSILTSSGYGCETAAGGTVCRIEQKTIDLDDNEITFGETHLLRGNAWISTSWIMFAPDGYTEDIAATLWP